MRRDERHEICSVFCAQRREVSSSEELGAVIFDQFELYASGELPVDKIPVAIKVLGYRGI